MFLRFSGPGIFFQACIIPLLALTVGCAQPLVPNAPSGTMDVLGPVGNFGQGPPRATST